MVKYSRFSSILLRILDILMAIFCFAILELKYIEFYTFCKLKYKYRIENPFFSIQSAELISSGCVLCSAGVINFLVIPVEMDRSAR